jgi:hypothetical protein
VDFGVDGAPRSAEELLARVAWAEQQVFSIKGEARLAIDSPQGKGAVGLFVAVMHPALIHLEQLDFFGRPQSVLVTDGERFGLYDAQAGRYLRGPATSVNLARVLPVVMPPAELAGVLLGRAPRITADAREFRFDDALGQFVVTITRGRVKQTLHVQPPSYRVTHSRAENLDAYELTFAGLSAFGGATLPRVTTLTVRPAKTEVELTWRDIDVNQAPDLSLFELEAPEGVPVIEVDPRGVILGASEAP